MSKFDNYELQDSTNFYKENLSLRVGHSTLRSRDDLNMMDGSLITNLPQNKKVNTFDKLEVNNPTILTEDIYPSLVNSTKTLSLDLGKWKDFGIVESIKETQNLTLLSKK